jgi:soluble lytic murein transglycosylase-like protein
MEVVNNLTPRQQQLLQKYKTPERSARGLGGTGKYEASTVPKGYGEAIQQSADKYGIPPSIIAGLIETESNWNPNAVSHAGARGLAQFMPATAAEQGVNVSDPMSSIDGAAKYLSYLVDYFKGDMRKAIFAYNGGMGNIEKYGGPIPGSKENQEYYGKVMNGAYKYGYGKQSLQDPAVMRPSIAAQIPR